MPYTYLLHHKPTNTFYYGVRWAKECNVDELWVSYFSSSNRVKRLREEYGDDSFEFEIRKTFKTTKCAREWEHKVLRRMKVLEMSNIWLNRTDNKAILNDKPYWLGRKDNPMKGKHHTAESRVKISLSRTGKCLNINNPSKRLEVRKKISDNNPMKRPKIKALFSERMKGNTYGIGNTNAKKLKGRKQSLEHIAARVASRKRKSRL